MKRLDSVVEPENNDEAWQDIIKDVKKLPNVEERPSAPLIIKEPCPNIDYTNVYTGNSLNQLDIGNVDNIDRRTAEKFKKGEFKIENRLDLHGLNENQAFAAVNDFIKKSYLQKMRCVLIITGKGINKDDTPWYEKKGILKKSVPSWLNSSELRPLILSFRYADPEDGGNGAICILLRRIRK